ncbi:hypothetical protein [Carnobacterium maltaromaticum]|uniref:hypothetical protein n=1 Tax=Carnobacterium maltaromaticum TaxID=2751 RepID=UPI0039BE804A
MLKTHKKIAIFIFTASLIFGTVYANQEFLKGYVFAEADEEISESVRAESGSEEEQPSNELKEDPVPPQQVEKKTKAILDDGWEIGTANDFIEKQGNKISWNNGGAWWYTYNGSSWVSGTEIEAVLLLNGNIYSGTSESSPNGFLWGRNATNVTYSINSSLNTLKKTFNYQRNNYQIEISQHLLEDGTVEISYQVTNNGSYAQKIGISQFVRINNSMPVRVLEDFKGLNTVYTDSNKILSIIPDAETLPNWSAGRSTQLKNFAGYQYKASNAVGWESGKKQPLAWVDLNIHQPLNVDDLGVVMKNPLEIVESGEAFVFKQRIRFGESFPPQLSVEQTQHTMYMHESFDLTGTISDVNDENYRLYLEMDNSEKTLIPLKAFKSIPLQEIQNYQATINGSLFTEGTHRISIVGIDEFGSRSEEQKIDLTIKKFEAIPVIQKVKKDENIQKELNKLFENITGEGIKLKSVADVDSTTVGFKWVDAILMNAELDEVTLKIPVTVYDPKTTTFNDTDNIALNVDTVVLTLDEFTSASQENRLNELLIQKSGADAWQLEDGEKANLTIVNHTVKPNMGGYTAKIRATRKGTTKFVEKSVDVLVTDASLQAGWEYTNSSASLTINGYKLNWNNGIWWYTHEGSSWMKSDSIEAALIINGKFLNNTSDVKGSGFIRNVIDQSIYSIQTETNSLRRTFDYLNKYTIEITQQLLGNYAVEVTYKVTNKAGVTQKIGISQYVDTFVGVDFVPVTPINDFKGINLTYGDSALAIIPDKETMPNWAAGNYSYVPKFAQYNVQNADGVGWETGKHYRGPHGAQLFSPTRILKENQSLGVGDSALSMKNPGVMVDNNESTSFKQLLKYGAFSAPVVTLNQSKASMYQDEKVTIDGTIMDEDNLNYRLYLEMDDKDKTLVQLADYTNISYREVQNYQATIEGNLFSPGVHDVAVIGIDEYGARSIPQKLRLTIGELSGEPKINKLKLGEPISNDLNSLFNEVKGTDIRLKTPLSVDSSVVGFQWVEAILTDGKRDIIEKIPVNIYNPESTIFNDRDNIALDAKDSDFELVDVRQNNEAGTLDELVRQKIEPKAWNMADGTVYPVEIITNSIKPIFGNYRATFKVTTGDAGKNLQKNSELSVGGELKFKNIPENLDYKTTKLSQKMPYVGRAESDWKIDLENTIGSNWSLFASAVPFENTAKEKLKSALIFKQNPTQDVVINGTNQKIAMGTETYPTIRWSETAGLLLKVSPDAKVGSYQGEITWLLSDAP